ncbi:histone H4-like [Hemibagrus wyckioides]|uniref:histone H4-like n=1 Tax=Hemibagrus wyckioides TaxID=337641 RepID=UPI00266B48EB|nr:histone H4-like [Hemibagrus wyckioides]
MCGKGKHRERFSKWGARCHHKVLNIHRMTKPAVRRKRFSRWGARRQCSNIQRIFTQAVHRLVRYYNVKLISSLTCEDFYNQLKVFLENVIRDAVSYTEHAKRKVVTTMDVVYALKRQGRNLYGFND